MCIPTKSRELIVSTKKESCMLTDSVSRKNRKSVRNRSVTAKTNKFWSDRQKIEAVTTYLMLGGNAAMTARQLRIPVETIYTWKRYDWWHELVEEVRKEERLTLSTKLKNVMDTSWDVVKDRLEKGDWIYDQKAGELRRKPVSLRDAGKIAIDTANLRTKMDIVENHTVANEQIEEKLTKLAQAFTNLSKGITNNQAVEDIEFTEEEADDALYEGREEELQAGESPVQFETGATPESQ